MGILLEDSETIWDSAAFVLLLGFEGLLDLVEAGALEELRVLDDFSEGTVAWNDVSLDDLLEVLVGLVADSELRADVGADCFVSLLDVDVDDVVFKELPGQGEMVGASG